MKTLLLSFKLGLSQAWRSFSVLKKHRPEPSWARLLISTGIGLCFAFLFTAVPGLILGRLLDGPWMRQTLSANLLVSLSISYTIHALFRSVELLAPAALFAQVEGWRKDWRGGLFFAAIAIVATVFGGLMGFFLVGQVFRVDVLGDFLSQPSNLRLFGLLTFLITGANLIWWRMLSKQQALQLAATEAQLRLLQGQIEPHFLFNTLANVQSLIDFDAGRAKQMLEAFTDYLRVSLGQLRSGSSTVGAELAMAQAFLRLMQIRMGERLAFAVNVSVAASTAELPPLLLQPLIENAIHHGLEAKIEGGRISVEARVEQGRLLLSVADDGLGLNAPRRPGRRAGTGIALRNIRARLESLYPHNASLTLTQQTVGTLAELNLPFTQKKEVA